MATPSILLSVLGQPELYIVLNGLAEEWQPPLVRPRGLQVGLAQASVATRGAVAVGSRGYSDCRSTHITLLSILGQPELCTLLKSWAEDWQPPLLRPRALQEGLAQASVAIHEAVVVGARGYPNRRFTLQIKWILEFHRIWTEAFVLWNARLAAAAADPDKMSTTP